MNIKEEERDEKEKEKRKDLKYVSKGMVELTITIDFWSEYVFEVNSHLF